VSSNNSITETTTVSVQADMEITKTDDPDPVIAGNPLTYTLTITNNGPSDAQSVVVTDTLPSEVTYSGVSTTSCSQAGGVVTCTLGTMTPGASATVTITTDVPLGIFGSLQNQAEVSSSTTDPDTGNNTVVETTTAKVEANLAISKTDDPDPVFAGQPLTYTLTISNTGSYTATNVVVTDTLPAKVIYSLATPDQGICTHASGEVTCTLGTILPGGTATIIVTVDVQTSAYGGLTNTAGVTSDAQDTNPADNNVSEVTTAYIRVYLPLVIH
jgi:uncharacterized repeat protein (TIGR01451 family)